MDIKSFYNHLYSGGHYIFLSTVMTYLDGAVRFKIKEEIKLIRISKLNFFAKKQYKKNEIEYALNKEKLKILLKKIFQITVF